MNTVKEAVEAIASGKAVIVMDDEGRENEGDVIFAAEHATDELMAWTIRYTSGVVCAPMTIEKSHELALPPMCAFNEDPKGTAYTVSCDAKEDVTTGISAHDRAMTAKVLANTETTPTDLTRPGHMFPLVAAEGLLTEREGHTEAAVALCLLAGAEPVGIIAELVSDDGTMLRGKEVEDFAKKHDCPVITIEELKKHDTTELANAI